MYNLRETGLEHGKGSVMGMETPKQMWLEAEVFRACLSAHDEGKEAPTFILADFKHGTVADAHPQV